MKKNFLLLLVSTLWFVVKAQFAPQVGNVGTTAIHKDSSVFIGWATACTLALGWQNNADTTLGKAQVGDATYVTGQAGNGVASLGDGGSAVLTFAHPITNGVGYDFAVFENGFVDQTLAPGTAFLELAFVEVSSDGINFIRFDATCLNDTSLQIGGFEGMFAHKLNNLAGKYLGSYGTPFDLEELKDKSGLDVNHITHVKIIDVVGSLSEGYASRDAQGNKINDPWPTPFASSGFDLDAVGVIHQDFSQGLFSAATQPKFSLYPNPTNMGQQVSINHPDIIQVKIIDLMGKKIHSYKQTTTPDGCMVQIDEPGSYLIELQTSDGIFHQRLIVR
jgi:hypothetical protein